MPQYIEVGGVFAPDEGGERDISHHIEHDHGQCGDSTEEAEDLTRSEEDADEQETHNLEDLLYVNRNIGCFVHRVDLLQGRRKGSRQPHCIHYTGRRVGTGNPYRQCAVDNGEEDEPPTCSPQLLGQGVIGIIASRGKCCHVPCAPANGAGIGHEDVKDSHDKQRDENGSEDKPVR